MWPAVFFGHGNPMNALLTNGYTQAWRAMGEALGKPRAVLLISAHWFIPEVAVTMSTSPRTIHDFGGFPDELYRIRYPAAGEPELALRVQQLLSPMHVKLDHDWGLDHGAWSVLRHVYPDHDVPVVQLSIDSSKPAAFHFELGRKLAPLRQEGILIAGSGNLVHNLHAYAWGQHAVEPYVWATRFEASVRALLRDGDDRVLVDYEALGEDAMLSVPTPDHYLPLLYVLGTRGLDDAVTFPVEGVDGGSISMLAVELDSHER